MQKAPVSRAQTLTGAMILALLAVVALGVFYKQARYNPALWGAPSQPGWGGPAVAAGSPGDLASLQPAGLEAMGRPERFGPETLSDKINGKAELYLAAGFEAMTARRYRLPSQPQAWFEAFVFEMKDAKAAYSVFSTQRRDRGQKLELAATAHLSGNSLFVLHGPWYLEIIAAGAQPELVQAMRAWLEAWLARAPALEAAAPDERGLFPPAGLQKETIALLAANVFGFDRFSQVYAAGYLIDGLEATAFISRRADAAQAAELASAYRAFLLAAGGREEPADSLPAGGRLVNIMDAYDLVFSRGAYLAGVHQAESRELALALGRALDQRLAGAVKP
ncbi:MAG: DUF6599 family protein [Thermodesulfobacteriota bacterium]